MLFDLKGKRRRAVQGTYLTLAILMGAGLVLFGIGSSTSGGLGDLFSGGGGSNKGHDVVPEKNGTPGKQLQGKPPKVTPDRDPIPRPYKLPPAPAGKQTR